MSGKVELTRVVDANAEQVFAAWTNAELVSQWIWASLACDVRANVEARPGGECTVVTRRPRNDANDFEEWSLNGKFVEVAQNERLVLTIRWDAPMGYEPRDETISAEFVDNDGRCEMRFCHESIPQESLAEHAKGWNEAFDDLEALLRNQ